jgi:hypothetical protein
MVFALLAFVPRRRGLLTERGLSVDHVTVWRWVQRYPVFNSFQRKQYFDFPQAIQQATANSARK